MINKLINWKNRFRFYYQKGTYYVTPTIGLEIRDKYIEIGFGILKYSITLNYKKLPKNIKIIEGKVSYGLIKLKNGDEYRIKPNYKSGETLYFINRKHFNNGESKILKISQTPIITIKNKLYDNTYYCTNNSFEKGVYDNNEITRYPNFTVLHGYIDASNNMFNVVKND